MRSIAVGAVAAALAGGIGGCGAGKQQTVVMSVGRSAYTKSTVDHWMLEMNAGRKPVGDGQRASLRRQALSFLLTSSWLIGEAESRGLQASASEVQRRVAEKTEAEFPGGKSELARFQDETGQSAGDLELEARREIASGKLRALAKSSAAEVTPAEIRAYYAHHRQSFFVPERRRARFADSKSRAAAIRLKAEVQAGRNLTSDARRRAHEVFMNTGRPPGQRSDIEVAIYAAPPHTVAGPFKIGADYFLFKVTRVLPSFTRPLAQVEAGIRRRLTDERRRRSLELLIGAMRTKWTAETDCRAGYVVQGCRQYHGPSVPAAGLGLG